MAIVINHLFYYAYKDPATNSGQLMLYGLVYGTRGQDWFERALVWEYKSGETVDKLKADVQAFLESMPDSYWNLGRRMPQNDSMQKK
jgi:hypothetical protein